MTSHVRKIATDTLRELLDCSEGEGFDGFEYVTTVNGGKGRWVSHHKLIFRFDGKLWAADFNRGLTEYQETYPFEDDGPEVDCYEVTPHAVTVTTYKPVVGDA